MRFLADESCDFAVVRALRVAGHDVLAIAETARGAKDREVIRLARDERRVLLTEDKDFGWLVFVAHMQSPGVILIRFPAAARHQLNTAVRQLIASQAQELVGSFVVLQPNSIRISRSPN